MSSDWDEDSVNKAVLYHKAQISKHMEMVYALHGINVEIVRKSDMRKWSEIKKDMIWKAWVQSENERIWLRWVK
jgi:hypothetical protein